MMTPDVINRFWLEEVGEKSWYLSSENLDDTIRDRFMQAWLNAEAHVQDWSDTAEGALAALILTDQMPRNMFRGDPRAFATDPVALAVAEKAIRLGFDQQIPVPQRQFFYLPFEHSEELQHQHRAVALFSEFMPGDSLTHAIAHRDTIQKFGRFPWRNNALGRENTEAELRCLDAGGYAAIVSGKVSLAEL